MPPFSKSFYLTSEMPHPVRSAEIVAIGTELTSGDKLDTNSQWLSRQLTEFGIPVKFHTTVADDLEANLQALQIAAARVDLIIITGGLGPTLDDLTREVLARLAGVELQLDPDSLAAIEAFFRGRGRDMPERNRIQACFPAGSLPLPNPIGTAPGIWLELPRTNAQPCLIAALPGVPSEMYKMFEEQVLPRLPGSGKVIRRARLNCFGLGESHTEQLLGDLTARGRDPEVGITAHEATITLRIIAQGETEAECCAKIDEASRIARERLGHYLFGTEDAELEDILVQLLCSQGQSLATVEIGSAGMLAARLQASALRLVSPAGAPGAGVFRSGLVLLESPQDMGALLAKHCMETGADWGLGIGPPRRELISGSPAIVMDLWLRDPGGELFSTPLSWNGNPAILSSRAAKMAANMLRLKLLGAAVEV